MNIDHPSLHKNFWQMRFSERRSLLILIDLIVALFSLFLSLYYWGMSERFMGFSLEFIQKRVPAWFYLLPLVWLILMVELYDLHRAADWGQTVRGVVAAAMLGVVLYLVLYFVYFDPPTSLLPRRGVASFLVIVTVLTLIWRRIYIRVFTGASFMRKVLLVGAGTSGQAFLKMVNELKASTYAVVGIIDDDPNKLGTNLFGAEVIGTHEQLFNFVRENGISDIIVAITGEMQSGMFQALLDAQEYGVEIVRMPTAYEEVLGRVPILMLEANWILRSFVDEVRVSGFYLLGKRLLDIIGGLIGSAIMLVLLPFVTLLTTLDDGFPIFYTQTRDGKGGYTYNIIKFRTMRRDAEADGHPRWAREDDERTTRVGKFLRKTHLDELPQFLNVLRGEMSLVGPRAERPEMVEYFQMRIPFYRARLLVKPGITGWAQVNYGYASTIEETIVKLEYDLYYIKNRSFFMDLVILLRTPATVLGLRGR
jgi:exopolysaccharide biosynthesis polyprenyl glycosylphosphotransferase